MYHVWGTYANEISLYILFILRILVGIDTNIEYANLEERNERCEEDGLQQETHISIVWQVTYCSSSHLKTKVS